MRFAVGALIALYAASCLDSIFPGLLGVLGLLCAGAAVAAACLVAFAGAVLAALRKRWARCGVRLAVVAVSVPVALAGPACGDWLHLLVMYPYYRSVIARQPQRPVRFPWGDRALTVVDGLDMRTLVYDDTGSTRRLAGLERRTSDGLFVTDRPFVGNFTIEQLYNR